MTGPRHVCLPAAFVCVAALAAGCGIASNGAATRVPAAQVPFGLARPDTATTTSKPPAVASETATLYFLGQNRLVPVARKVATTPTVDDLLRLLTGGMTDGEAAAGFRSALTSRGDVVSAATVRGTAVVGIGAEFTTLPSGEQDLAIAQIVYTVTELPGVGQVQFTSGGAPTEVPRGDGSLTITPVTRDDYPAIAPAPQVGGTN